MQLAAGVRLLAGILFAVAALVASAAPPEGHAKLQPAEWKAIQQVIGDQLKALKAGDGTKAMTYSVPGIRQQFRTPEGFLRMVREGYSALLDARSSTFLEGAVIGDETIQPLQLVLPDNTVVVALYTVVRLKDGQKDGQWRIAGCVIAPSTVQST
jgi:Domain of unknown function (DUF4864)